MYRSVYKSVHINVASAIVSYRKMLCCGVDSILRSKRVKIDLRSRSLKPHKLSEITFFVVVLYEQNIFTYELLHLKYPKNYIPIVVLFSSSLGNSVSLYSIVPSLPTEDRI